MADSTTVTVLLADPMQGVRDAWRELIDAAPGLTVVAEADSVAAACAQPGQAILAGLRFADGTVSDLMRRDPRPVVVWTYLPEDERADVALQGAAAVVEAGRLRRDLAAALRAAAARPVPGR